jgi:hypothetical protein
MSLKAFCVVGLDAGVFSRFSGTAVKRFFGRGGRVDECVMVKDETRYRGMKGLATMETGMTSARM